MVCWKVLDIHGQEVILTFLAYHIPAMSVHLLSPQTALEEMQGTEGQLLINKFWLILKSGIILDALFGHAHLSIPHSSVSSSPTSFCPKCLSSGIFMQQLHHLIGCLLLNPYFVW